MNVFTRTSACRDVICARPLPCFSGRLLFVLDTLSGLLTRSAVQGHWQMVSAGWVSWPRRHSPAASGQSSTQLQGGCLGHTHLQTQGAGRQVNLKHTCKSMVLHNCCYTRRHWQPRLRADFQCYNSFWTRCDFSRPVVVKVESGFPPRGNVAREVLQ